MLGWSVFLVALLTVSQHAKAGSPCPQFADISPCFCSRTSESQTMMICFGLKTSSELEKITNFLKGMVIEKFILFESFQKPEKTLTEIDEIESNNSTNEDARLPKEWLSSLRVKELIIHTTSFESCFLCDHPFMKQNDFLTNLVISYSSLEGQLCSVCNIKTKHISTKELLKVPKLKSIDLSHNRIALINGYGFPSLAELKKIDLSNNVITTINDGAFTNLLSISELNLSKNKLSTISRKIFRPSDNALRSLDLSWNNFQNIPQDMFHNLRGLREVKFNHNMLEVLPMNTWGRLPVVVEMIDVNGNFFPCNCSLSWTTKKFETVRFLGECLVSHNYEFRDINLAMSEIRNCV